MAVRQQGASYPVRASGAKYAALVRIFNGTVISLRLQISFLKRCGHRTWPFDEDKFQLVLVAEMVAWVVMMIYFA